ncbi:hypothetical protein [Fodinicola feengrottensis]|uniref:Uncharacterized protein n=1 Tax=Fodinicola feengrottensis TaxID=435914 RepID=A0ABN2IV17_9ACTN|nr:hypothetical protein [Fodinicola feengrottensis]
MLQTSQAPCLACGEHDCTHIPNVQTPFPLRSVMPEPTEYVLATDRVFDGGSLAYTVGDKVPLEVADRLGLEGERVTTAVDQPADEHKEPVKQARSRTPGAKRRG